MLAFLTKPGVFTAARNRLVFCWLLLGSFSAIFPQSNSKIAGVIKDAQTGEPLIGVNVVLEGTSLGAATDEDDGTLSSMSLPALIPCTASMSATRLLPSPMCG